MNKQNFYLCFEVFVWRRYGSLSLDMIKPIQPLWKHKNVLTHLLELWPKRPFINRSSFLHYYLTIFLHWCPMRGPQLSCSCRDRNRSPWSVNRKSCLVFAVTIGSVIHLGCKWLSVDAQGQRKKVSSGEAVLGLAKSVRSFVFPCFLYFIRVTLTPSAAELAAGEGTVQQVLTEPRGTQGKDAVLKVFRWHWR